MGVIAAKLAKNSNFFFVFGLVAILAILLIPLPTFILDMGITFSISLAVAVLIIVISTNKPLDLSTFPSLLLVLTLFRLSLNVASTRMILTEARAGAIIDTFGNFVAGGNLIVGIVMFTILVVIQFIVITKGSQRIGEVGARFVLDAMPGKQMAIDADLNAGHITEEEAKQRRDEIVRESEFYGAMDGAGKFISGDVKAGLIITAVNLIGGILLGYTNGMPLAEAARRYSILSIGDGLVSQIPSIIISVSAGFLVSKIRSENTVSYDLTKQLLHKTQPIAIASVVIGAFALVPGFPKIPFLLISGACGTYAFMSREKKEKVKTKEKGEDSEQDGEPAEEKPVEELLDTDVLSILVGVRLISMVDPRKQSSIFDRIGALRRKFAQQLGFIIPMVRIRDNISLEPNAYEIRLYDHVIAKGTLEPDRFLAMDSGTVEKPVKGIATKEPVYGLPAIWITEQNKEAAEFNGYTVIDPESVLITHLSETIARNAHELLTREDVQTLVDRLRQSQPSLVGEVVGECISIGMLQRVLQNLLKENISIRDMPMILETLGENASKTKSHVLLTELVRKSLKRAITERFRDDRNMISVIALDPAAEHQLIQSVSHQGEMINLAIEPETAMELNKSILNAYRKAMELGMENVVVICDSRIRSGIRNIIANSAATGLSVIAFDEVVPGTEIEPVETVKLETMFNASAAANQPVGAM